MDSGMTLLVAADTCPVTFSGTRLSTVNPWTRVRAVSACSDHTDRPAKKRFKRFTGKLLQP